jgi:hypothetical protein
MSVMADASPVPRRVKTPSWLDLRLLLGIAMVLAAVLLGAVVVSRAQRTRPVVAATRDLSAGTVLTPSDLTVLRVQLAASSAALYVGRPALLVGRQLLRAVQGGELITRTATQVRRAATTLSVPFPEGSAPVLHAGQRIEIWLSSPACRSVVLLSDVTVQSVHAHDTGLSAADGQVAVIDIDPALADRVVAALDLDQAHLRAGVLHGSTPRAGDPQAVDPRTCASPSR